MENETTKEVELKPISDQKIANLELSQNEATILFQGLDALIRQAGVNLSPEVLILRDKINNAFN